MTFDRALSSESGHQNEAFVDLEPTNLEPLNELKLRERLGYKKLAGDNILESTKTYVRKYYKPSGPCFMNYFLERFPFFKWITLYNVREDLVKDLVAGITIGVVHIPQLVFI
jgi:hypothetical protein